MSYNFTVTRNEIIIASLRKLGQIEPGDTIDTIDPSIINNAVLNFNIIVKQLMTKGIKLWTIQEYTIPYVVNQIVYTIGEGVSFDVDLAKPLKLIQGFLRNTSTTPVIDIPMQLISQQEYNLLGSKASTGITNSLYMNIRQDSSDLYVWLAPDANTTADYELHITVQRAIADMNDNDTDIVDFPNEWYNTLVWTLADDLAIEFEVPQNHRAEIASKAITYQDLLEGWDVEYTSTYFQVDTRATGSPYFGK